MILSFGAFAPLASIAMNVAQASSPRSPGSSSRSSMARSSAPGGECSSPGSAASPRARPCFWIARTFGTPVRRADLQPVQDRRRGQPQARAPRVRRDRHGAPVPRRAVRLPLVLRGSDPRAVLAVHVATALGSAPHAFLYAFMGSSLDIPLWMGVLMTPALGLVYAGVQVRVKALRRGRESIGCPRDGRRARPPSARLAPAESLSHLARHRRRRRGAAAVAERCRSPPGPRAVESPGPRPVLLAADRPDPALAHPGSARAGAIP